MKPAIITHNQTCIFTGNDALKGRGGSQNPNAQTPLSGGNNLIAKFFQSAGTIGLSSRIRLVLIFMLTTFLTAAQTVIREGDVFTENGIHYKVTRFGLVSGNSVAVCNGGTRINAYSGYVIIPESVTFSVHNFNVFSLDEEAFINCSNLDSVFIPASIKTIGSRAFKNCTKLKKMTVPNTVTSIGNAAFFNCSSIRKVTLPNVLATISDSLFYQCYRLWDFILPEKITSIGNYAFASAFKNRDALHSIVIPDKVTTIGRGAFEDCTYLEDITFPASLITIGERAFLGCGRTQSGLNLGLHTVTLGDNVTTIGAGAFSSCVNLSSIRLSNALTSIQPYTFSTCNSLREVIIPNSVTTLSSTAFLGCVELNSVTLSNSMATIEDNTFKNLGSLQTVEMQNSNIVLIGTNAFENCVGLTKVVLPRNLTAIGGAAFYNCTNLAEVVLPEGLGFIGASAFNRCEKLTKLNLPYSVNTIGDYAFADCFKLSGTMAINQSLSLIGKQAFRSTDIQLNVSPDNKRFSSQEGVLFNKLKSVVLHCPTSLTLFKFPNTVKKIEEYAFSYGKLTNVVLPATLDTITNNAFRNSSLLAQLTLPASLQYVGEYAFSSCTALQTIRAYMDTPPEITTTVFGSVPASCKLMVLLGSLDLYKAATGWKNLTVISFGGAIGTVVNSNGLYYKIISETEAMVIANPNGSHNYLGEKTITATLNYQDMNYDVTSIDKLAFAYSGVTSVSIPGTVKQIGEWAFTNCQTLTGIVIPNSVTFIGKGAFSNCPILTSAVLSNTLTSIEDAIFQSCPALTNMVIPTSVLSIGEYAFDQCYGIVTLDIPQSVTQIGKWAFQLCTELQSINISNNVEILPNFVFWGCKSLQEVRLPESLKEIGEEAFYDCPELKEIELPANLTKIGASAFYKTALSVISLPATVNHIGQYAFGSCFNLKDVYAYNRTPIGISREVFGDIYHYHLNLFVRSRSIPLYEKTAVWKDFQIKSIESIHTNSIRELTGRDIVLNVNTMLVEEADRFTAFQFEMKYDTVRMVFKDYNTDNLMTNAGSVMVNSNTNGILKVGYMSNNHLSGEGTLIKLRFTLRNSGVVQPEFERFLYNAYDLINFNSGSIEVIAYGDVDYNQEVQSYDASLVLINSVGLNPIAELETYPWSALRNDVSDVDASTTLTAHDAGLILSKAVDLLDKFPVEESKPAPVKRQNAQEMTDETDVMVTLVNNKLIFKSYGALIGLNVDIRGDISLLEMPQVHASFIQARNIHDQEYKIALATASVLPAATVIMTIPLKDELPGDLLVTMNINDVEKVVTVNKSISDVESVNESRSPVYLNALTGELIILNPVNVRSIDVFTVTGSKVFAQLVNSDVKVRPGISVSGVYLVVLTGVDGNRSSTKIIVK